MTARPAWRWLAGILMVHAALGIVYMWATPIFEASDEGWHYAVVHWLAGGNPLPVQNPDRPKSETTWEQEGSQPPLYYWLAAGLTFWVPTDDFEEVFVRNPFTRMGTPGTEHNVNLYQPLSRRLPLHGTALAATLIRCFSLVLSLGTILATFFLARRVFPEAEAALALLAAALVAFNPMALFINASVNNDNLLMLVNSAALWLLLDMIRPAAQPTWTKLIGLGLLLGMAALTKVSGLLLWPITVIGLGWAGYRQGVRPWQIARRLGIVLVLALALSGWWFLRNWQLYGELLGTRTMALVAGLRTINTTLWELITQEWASFYLSYWGIFGVFSIRPGEWVIIIFNLLSLWSLAGLVWMAVRRQWRWTLAAFLCLAVVAATFVGVVNWSLQTMASQGRLMFGTIAPISALMAAGILSPLPERWRRWVSLGLSGGLAVAAAVVPFTDIAPHYTLSRLAEAELPADLRPVQAVIADGMELIGYTSDEAPLHPGDEQRVTLYWRALEPMNANYVVVLGLLGRELKPLNVLDTWPGGGLAPTSLWEPGMILRDTYELPISAAADVPSRMILRLSAWVEDWRNSLPIRTPAGDVTDVIHLPVGRVVAAGAAPLIPPVVDGSMFEYGITLLGWEAETSDTLSLRLYWKTDRPIPADYTIFVQVIDAGGTLVAQGDSPPLAGDWPTSAWVPGQAFAETRRIVLPTPLPPNCCAVRLGFYAPPDGERLLAFHADGAPWPDKAVILEEAVTPR